MAGSVTYPRTTWILVSTFLVAASWDAVNSHETLAVWVRCFDCASAVEDWRAGCWAVVGAAGWMIGRTLAATAHWLTWWYRRGHWLPPSRPELDTYPNDQAAWNARIERVELWLYMAFAIWIWWRLGICNECPRWTDDPDSSCGRYMTLGGTAFMALLGFAILRAYFGPLPERPARD